MTIPTLHKVESSKSLNDIARDFPAVAKKHGMTIMSVQDLRQSMESKGVSFGRNCRVFQVCCPQQARTVLENRMDVATVIPCRVAIYEEGGRTVLSAVNPTVLLGLFGAPGLMPTAERFQEILFRILDDVAGVNPAGG